MGFHSLSICFSSGFLLSLDDEALYVGKKETQFGVLEGYVNEFLILGWKMNKRKNLSICGMRSVGIGSENTGALDLPPCSMRIYSL